MKNKGFTLIELLAVIIILGILMLIAIPSVTNYINNSRKETYVDTVKELIKGATMLVNSGEFEVNDTNTTYYIPTSAIDLENGEARSPYGKFEPAYIAVTYDGDEYDYYYIGKDEADMGTDTLIKSDNLDKDSIKSGITSISTDNGIGNKEKIVVFKDDGSIDVQKNSTKQIDGDTGEEIKILCKRATQLHHQTCEHTDGEGCGKLYETGTELTFGSYGERGKLKAGDAFDCDVNADGEFDPETERFYYLTKEGNTSSLIYSYNTKGDVITDYDYDDIVYYDDGTQKNWLGPVRAYKYLPSLDYWKNDGIIPPGKRQITNELGGITTPGGTIVKFDYEDRAARLMTYKEVMDACNISEFGTETEGELDSCMFLLENHRYFLYDHRAYVGGYGYWLETVNSSRSHMGYIIYGKTRIVDGFRVDFEHSVSVRPVITVYTSSIEK